MRILFQGAKKACEAMRGRMDPVKAKLEEEKGTTPTWQELVKACLTQDVDLSERYWSVMKVEGGWIMW